MSDLETVELFPEPNDFWVLQCFNILYRYDHFPPCSFSYSAKEYRNTIPIKYFLDMWKVCTEAVILLVHPLKPKNFSYLVDFKFSVTV